MNAPGRALVVDCVVEHVPHAGLGMNKTMIEGLGVVDLQVGTVRVGVDGRREPSICVTFAPSANTHEAQAALHLIAAAVELAFANPSLWEVGTAMGHSEGRVYLKLGIGTEDEAERVRRFLERVVRKLEQ